MPAIPNPDIVEAVARAPLTKAQRQFMLELAGRAGSERPVWWGSMSGSGGARYRMAERLAQRGLIKRYEWTLTEAGLAALSEPARGREAEGG